MTAPREARRLKASLRGYPAFAAGHAGTETRHEKTSNPTESNFARETERSDRPVPVEFRAEWCGPCRAMRPVVAELGLEYRGFATIFALDVDEEPALARRFEVRAIPALVFFRNGAVVDRAVGRTPKDRLAAKLETLVNPESAEARPP